MSRFFLLVLLLFFNAEVAAGETVDCSNPTIHQAAKQVDVARRALLALPIGDGLQNDVPAEAQSAISAMRARLADFIGGYMRCSPANIDPRTVQSDLSRLAHAFVLPSRVYRKSELPPNADNYGFQLRFEVRAAVGRPAALGIAAHFQIECGWDAVLLVFARRHGMWNEIIRWQSRPYSNVGGAFGNFDFAISPPDRTGSRYVLTKHIAPWCTSTWSSIYYSVLRPGASANAPEEVFSASDPIWWGGGDFGRIAAGRDQFEIRFHAESIDPLVHNRVWIRRYAIVGDRVRRIPPVALSPRDFVDEWIVSSWEEASGWSNQKDLPHFKHIHEALHKIGAMRFDYRSFRRCSDARSHFQIEVAPGDDRVSYYFRVRKRESYMLMAVTKRSDAACDGANLLAPTDN